MREIHKVMVQVFTKLSSYASGENEKNGGESNSIITSKSLNYPIFLFLRSSLDHSYILGYVHPVRTVLICLFRYKYLEKIDYG